MSILARAAVEKNLEQIRKQLERSSEGSEELTALQTRLATERDKYVQALIREKISRLEKVQKPNRYAEHRDALTTLASQLEAVLQTMETIPWYTVPLRGGRATKQSARKKATKT